MPFTKTQNKFLALTQARDWSTTSLGHPSTWPHGLRTLIQHMLNSQFPMFLAWGSELSCVYNEAYRIFLGEKHPHALGEPFRCVWAEIWDEVSPLVDQALAGDSPYQEDRPLAIQRYGRTEQTWFTFSYSPAFDDANRVAGVLCTVVETTGRVLAERRHTFQLKLTDVLRRLTQPLEVTAAAAKLIGEHLQVGRVGYANVDETSERVSFVCDWSSRVAPELAGQTRALTDFSPPIIDELRKGRTVPLDDILADDRLTPYVAAYTAVGARAFLAVPLRESGGLTVVLFLHEEAPRHWTQEDVTLVEDAAQRTWDAVKRLHVESKLRDESRTLELLYETGRVVSSTLDIRTLLQTITDQATALCGAKFGAFFYAPKTDEGESAMLYTLSGAPREAFEQLGVVRRTSVLSPLFHCGAPIRSDDITKDARYGKTEPHCGMPPGHLPVRSYLAVPVVLRSGESAGGLIFGHPEPGVFNERAERMLVAVASQAATALDNARLYEDAQRAAKERQELLARERAARAEAEKLSKAKDEFLAMLAHELRNPLAPISSAAELLARVQLDAPRIQATSGIIVRQVKHMTGLIDDLLDVSRVTRGLVVLSRDIVDMKRVVADAVEQVRPAVDRRRQQLNMALAPGVVQVQGDHKRLVQVLGNILGNAAKYTPDGGQIDIRLEEAGSEVTVHVSDNGIGMSPELLPNIFELFTQADRTSDRSQGGLGLGLALAKSLAQLHGGTLNAHSDGVGQGSTFSLRLPRLVGAPLPQSPAAGGVVERTFRPLRVLVVDDNTDAAATLTLFLECEGHKVVELHSSETALRYAHAQPFDACLLDIGLPGMDGLDLARKLRQLPTTKDALLIAVTGYGRQSDRDNATAAGFDHYVVKPARAAELLGLLAERAHTA
jgi:signal transduction histidine kinase/CheY-like chemotaxis protein